MSNSSDGRKGTRHVPPRGPEPGTRAERRYQVDDWRPQQADEPWSERGAEDDWYREEHGGAPQMAPGEPGQAYDPYGGDVDPRTGSPAFELPPSPLQPRSASQRMPAGAPLPPPPPRGRLPQRPEDLAADRSVNFGPYPPDPHAAPRAIPPHQPDPRRPAPQPDRDLDQRTLTVQSRARHAAHESANAPIVPAGSVTGRSLTLVVAIMCFLACLTAGAVYLMNESARAWMHDIASEVTVQIEAYDKADLERDIANVTAFLEHEPGITKARPLSLETSVGLLEPWLGQADVLKSLPVPRLIAVEVNRDNPPDFDVLGKKLGTKFKGAVLDDHRHWQRQIRTVTSSFALGGFAILILVGAATMAIIITATRSALASNRDIVEVLHFVGATDKFIARQFQRHFLGLGVRAGLIGASLAAIAFVAFPLVIQYLSGSSASVAELQQLVGTGALDLLGYCLLIVVVVVVAALCMVTSRIGVYRILNSQH